jgi:hypothetical protein
MYFFGLLLVVVPEFWHESHLKVKRQAGHL